MMQDVTQVLMGMLGTFGFSVLFHVKWRRMIPIVLAAGLTWTAYLVGMALFHEVWVATLISTITAGVASFIYARAFQAPIIIFMVPILVPLIPGGDLYRTTSYLVTGNAEMFRQQGILLAKEGGAMAFGIILVSCITHLPFRIHKTIKSKGNT